MSCEARSPETGEPCRIEGTHALHIAGYGSSMTQWEAEDFLDPRHREEVEDHNETLNAIARGVRRTRESVAVAHHDDPDTSWDAAALHGDIGERQLVVLEMFDVFGPMSPEQVHIRVCQFQGKNPQTATYSTWRSLVSDLHRHFDPPLITNTGRRVPQELSEADTYGVVWEINEVGRAVLRYGVGGEG